MAKSLQDQLLNMGVASEKQAKKIKADKRKQKKQQQKNSVDEKQNTVKQAALAKAEKDKQLNKLKQQQAEQKAKAAQIKQLIDANKMLMGDEQIAYHFAVNNKIKTVYVNDSIKAQLTEGKLAIVACDTGYQVVNLEIAEKIKSRDSDSVFVQDQSEKTTSENDDYKDFEIPDDLMW